MFAAMKKKCSIVSFVITLLILLLTPNSGTASKFPNLRRTGSSPSLSPKCLVNREESPITRENEEKLNEVMTSVKDIKDILNKIEKSISGNEVAVKELVKNSKIFLRHLFYESCEDFQRREKDSLASSKSSHNINLVPLGGHYAKARCEVDSAGVPWTVILDRYSGVVKFDRTYLEYELGFGNTETEYYIGNRALSELTATKTHLLRVEVHDSRSNLGWAEYKVFKVSGPEERYRLSLQDFDRKSTIGDGLSVNDGMQFSTYDRDSTNKNCSLTFGGGGGWWFIAGTKKGCYNSLPTGVLRPDVRTSTAGGISYSPWPKGHKPLTKFKLLMKLSVNNPRQ